MIRSSHLLSQILILAGLGIAFPACGPDTALHPASGAALLPPWDGPAAELFDDGIDASAVGLGVDGLSPKADPLLKQRARGADLVARVKVTTVTIDTVGVDSTYHLGIVAGYPPLSAPRIPEQTFELHIRPKSRAFGIARAFGVRLQGVIFVGFLRKFRGADGNEELHWHLSADTPEVIGAVREAVALAELSGS